MFCAFLRETECCVCLEPLVPTENAAEEDSLAALPCGHVFHYACVQQQVEHAPKCPLCRQDFKATSITPLDLGCKDPAPKEVVNADTLNSQPVDEEQLERGRQLKYIRRLQDQLLCHQNKTATLQQRIEATQKTQESLAKEVDELVTKQRRLHAHRAIFSGVVPASAGNRPLVEECARMAVGRLQQATAKLDTAKEELRGLDADIEILQKALHDKCGGRGTKGHSSGGSETFTRAKRKRLSTKDVEEWLVRCSPPRAVEQAAVNEETALKTASAGSMAEDRSSLVATGSVPDQSSTQHSAG